MLPSFTAVTWLPDGVDYTSLLLPGTMENILTVIGRLHFIFTEIPEQYC